MDIRIDVELVAQVTLALIAAGIVVTKLIDALKARGTIEAGKAGEWNQLISFIIAASMFVIRWIGFDQAIPQAEALGAELSAIFVTGFTVAIVAKGLHHVVNWLEGRQRAETIPAPK